MNVQRLTLDLDKSSVPRGRVTIAQCDHDGTTVEAEIYDNGVALGTSGLSAYLVMRLPDGRHYYRVPATLDGHVATALVDEAYAATATGTTEIAYFELVGSGGVVYSTSRFGVRVLPSATADATVPETWDGEVERLIQQLDEMAEDSREIIDDLTTLEEIVSVAERGRVSAESGRVSAETARANAETARRNAETARANAESGRVTAEQGRVAAESSRASEFSTLKSESQAATNAANTAAGNAGAAATSANTAANVANAAAANADATADGVESRVQEMAQDAAETATADAEQRIQDAIDAMGDISELAVPLMSKDTRGGAKLEEHGGLALRDGALGIGSLVQESDGYARGGIAGLTAEGHAEQDGTPTPDSPVEIQVVTGHTVTGKTGRFVDLEVQGKNLFDIDSAIWTGDGAGYMARHGTGVKFNGIAPYGSQYAYDDTRKYAAGTFTYSHVASEHLSRLYVRLRKYDDSGWMTSSEATISGMTYLQYYMGWFVEFTVKNASITFEIPNCAYWELGVGYASDDDPVPRTIINIQLEEGSTATEYEPYYHSTTPISLPQRGWVAGLPDGTADVLTLDGAGKVTWELRDAETTTAATDGITGTVGVDVLSTTGQIADGATVLYKLATPVTEDLGYIDLPSIDGECQISIPELDELGVRYFVDDSAGALARQWYKRAQSEYETRLSTLESIVAELV